VGRPYAGRALYERIHWVDWVETYAKEYKHSGSKKPYLLILLDLLEMTGGHLTAEKQEKDEGPTDDKAIKAKIAALVGDKKRFARIQKSFKKKRLNARRELRLMKKWAGLYRGWRRHGGHTPDYREILERRREQRRARAELII
jgi:hypothetical protein